jgi:hypothetical protein
MEHAPTTVLQHAPTVLRRIAAYTNSIAPCCSTHRQYCTVLQHTPTVLRRIAAYTDSIAACIGRVAAHLWWRLLLTFYFD